MHGDLKLVLRTVLPVEGRRMIIEVHHADRDRRNIVVQKLIVWSYFSRLGLNK